MNITMSISIVAVLCELLHSISNSTTVLLRTTSRASREARRVVLGWRMGLIEMSLSIHIDTAWNRIVIIPNFFLYPWIPTRIY